MAGSADPRESVFALPNRAARCGVALVLALLLTSGCAHNRARKHLEGVAKGWCETIRASQVIPVYPLTEDLQPGDVFLVQTTLESQARLYRKRGFLSLDDHRVRLQGLQYTNVYFDGYWKDRFGQTPHDLMTRTNVGSLHGTNQPVLTDAAAPRAAFPTYSFAAKSGFGLSLAIPVKGVPVGLNFLRSDRVNGSVTIADARTYAADAQELYEKLHAWAEQTSIRPMLSETVEKTKGRAVFLRVISRVYLTGGVIVALTRAETAGAGLKAGNAPAVPMVDAQGNVNSNLANVLRALDAQASPVTAMSQAGGAVKFVGASESSVALAESFDRLLVIGYLGFDVPVYPGGVIGAPIPTFQRLTGQLSDPPRARVGPLTMEQSRFQATQDLLEMLAQTDGDQALNVMGRVLEQLRGGEFKKAREALMGARRAQGTPEAASRRKTLLTSYKLAASSYVTPLGTRGPRYARYDEAFLAAYQLRNQPQ